ncbi:MAG TPA: dihydroorotate dehydrogenase [Candidatus Omnitrophota bacterium]|nr:dihydroorotate dehydrogenase [Candidatus Omnitrophota bacterium]
MTDLSLAIGTSGFHNPVWLASGTCGSGEELESYTDLGRVGAIVTKTVTLTEREGNLPPRVIETASGMMNSIGLENKGALWFRENKYGWLKEQKAKIVVSFSVMQKGDASRCAEILSDGDFPDAVEMNLSCPNVAHGEKSGRLLAQDAKAVAKTVKEARKATRRPIIVKLSPNVTDIGEIAVAAETAGADAIAAVNTYQGIVVDAERQRPYFNRVVGGLSGPAIKPLALKAVRDVYKAVKIPVVGIGGIMNGTDVAEFMLAGASAVQVGTASLRDPSAHGRILDEFLEYLGRHGVKRSRDLVGKI